MPTILHVTASARTSRSDSRALGEAFLDAFAAATPDLRVIRRDVGANPPPIIDEAWIAAAFTPEAERSPEQSARLALSDTLIDEVIAADIVSIATPLYNYGMPAALKAWLDQIVRIGLTFSFDLARGDFPLEPMLSGRTLVALTASGEFGFGPGGPRDGMNHLLPHLSTVSRYLGVETQHHVGIEYQEFRDARHAASRAAALEAARALGQRLAREAAVRAPAEA